METNRDFIESERLYDMLVSDDPGMHKAAAQDLSDFTRLRVREGSWLPKIIEPSPFDRARLQQSLYTDQPVMYFEFEPDSPFAVPVDYTTGPSAFIPKGRRYPVVFHLYQTPISTLDILELQTYTQDLREIAADNKTKDLIALRDHSLISSVRKILGTTPGTVLPWVGKAMYQNTGQPLTFAQFVQSLNVMLDTPFSIAPVKALAYHTRRTELARMAVEEGQGTDWSVDIMVKGWTEVQLAGVQIMLTIKKQIVPRADMFFFGPQENLGRYVECIPPTMTTDKKRTSVEFGLHEAYGLTVAHPGACSIVQFL